MPSPESKGEPNPNSPRPTPPKEQKPWPMTWIVIAILAYVTFQVGYFLFYGG
jgi:hypothetical protein